MKLQRRSSKRIARRCTNAARYIVAMVILALSGNASAQWVQPPGDNTEVNYQFPSAGHVTVGATTPSSYTTSYRLEIFGLTRFAGNSIVDNGNLSVLNGNLSVTGNGTFLPNGGVAPVLTLTNAAGTFSTAFRSVATANVVYNLPPADGTPGQVLSTNGAAALNWITPPGGVGGGGNPPFIPLWTALNTLGNSNMTQNGAGDIQVWFPPPGFPPPLPSIELLQIGGNTRLGPEAAPPAPVIAAPTNGSFLFFSGVPGQFAGPPFVSGDNSDIIAAYRTNVGMDVSELRLDIGDNPEGDVVGPGGLPNTPDQLTIGSTNAFAPAGFKQMFALRTDGKMSIGYNVGHANALDVGWALTPGGGTPPFNLPSANVAIGQGYAGVVAAPVNGLLCLGNAGFGVNYNLAAPGNQVEIRAAPALGLPAGVSGLRLTDLATGATRAATYAGVLSVNASGDVILVPGSSGTVSGSGNGRLLPVWNAASGVATTTLANSVIYDDATTHNIGINTTSASSTLSFNFGSGTSPSAQTIGVERTTTASANGTPLSISAGAAKLSGSNLNGGDLVLAGGTSTGSGGSNIDFQVATGGTSSTSDHTPASMMTLHSNGDLSLAGEGAKNLYMLRNSTTSGQSLTVQGGGAKSGGTDLAGGDLILAGGISTGNASTGGFIRFQTPTPAAGSGSGSNLPSTKVVIDPNGRVGIGTATPGAALDIVNGDLNVSGAGFGNINISGTGTSTGGGWVSDMHLKKNVTDLSNALARVNMLHPVEFDFRQDEYPQFSFPVGHQIGFIAQEIESVVPEVVSDAKGPLSGFKAVSYQNLTALLTAAIKEQQTEIAAKDAQIADLNARMSKLEAAVFALSANTGAFKSNGTTLNGDEVVFYQNNPNPFGNSTTISYHLPQTVSNAELLVMAANGAEVMRLPLAATGNGTVVVSADRLSAGQYFFTIVADGIQSQSKTMTVIK